ncbi:hypothetical protein OG988_06075 [Streptomyces zaomyceticus]|uniref:hypothetical protein n=1 Tax=Streptomyces zaomyceticus TaxID=68286 RepID=UPI002E13FAC9|nr:hypothetical protein OG237_35655 [Streptomyces zaomyceticus]
MRELLGPALGVPALGFPALGQVGQAGQAGQAGPVRRAVQVGPRGPVDPGGPLLTFFSLVPLLAKLVPDERALPAVPPGPRHVTASA